MEKTLSWETVRTVYKVSDFVSWQRTGSLTLSPSFQRRPVWKAGAKSYFVDSVARGLPIPIIFIRERRTNLKSFEPTREVVDGQQRIRTLISYIDPMALSDYNAATDAFTVKAVHNRELSGKAFSSLPSRIQQAILDYQFSVHVLPAGVDDRDILQMFTRMNSTGVKLNNQELRNAQWFGEFKTLVYSLAIEQLERWRDWKVFTEQDIARMLEVELTSELILFMLKGVSGKSQASLDSLYRDYDEKFDEKDDVCRRFREVMEQIAERFDVNRFRKSGLRQKAVFYSFFAVCYSMVYGESGLASRKPKRIDATAVAALLDAGTKLLLKTAPPKAVEATERRTTNVASRKLIFDFLMSSTFARI